MWELLRRYRLWRVRRWQKKYLATSADARMRC
jgi:hypothetical protein